MSDPLKASAEVNGSEPFAEARGSAALGDKELASEIIQCLRVNMLRGTMTTENDEQFWAFINAWGQGKSAMGIKPPNHD